MERNDKSNIRLDPSKITVSVGTEVTWINEDELDHTITSGNWSIVMSNQVHPILTGDPTGTAGVNVTGHTSRL